MTRNLPLMSSTTLKGLLIAALAAVCATAAASPIVTEAQSEMAAFEDVGTEKVAKKIAAPPSATIEEEPSLAALGLGFGVEERTETLLTYFGIEPRLTLPLSRANDVTVDFGAQHPVPVNAAIKEADLEVSAVPEPKEMLILVVGAALLAAGIALRSWLGDRS